MSVDTGKTAKQFGRTRPRDAKKVDQDPIRVPPHKKPRSYRLTIEYQRVSTTKHTKEFTTKAAMQEFRKRAERAIEEQKQRDVRKKSYSSYFSAHIYDLRMDYQESEAFKAGPVITEEMIDTVSMVKP